MPSEKGWGQCKALHTQFLDPKSPSGPAPLLRPPSQNECGLRVLKHYASGIPSHYRILLPLQQIMFWSKYPLPLSTGPIPLRRFIFPVSLTLALVRKTWVEMAQVISPQMLGEPLHASTIFPLLLPWNIVSRTELLHQPWSPNEERIG